MSLPNDMTPDEKLRAKKAQEVEEARQEERAKILHASTDRVKRARKALEDAITGLVEASTSLREVARRDIDETSRAYVAFANGHIRTAAASLQGTKKIATLDRLLTRAQENQTQIRQAEERRARQQEVKAHAQMVRRLTLPSDDALEELYGEIVTDA